MDQILLNGITVDELVIKISELLDAKLKGRIPFPSESQTVYLSRNEVSKLLKISLPTLAEWTKLEWLKGYRIGGRVLYKLDEVKSSIEQVSINKHKKNIL